MEPTRKLPLALDPNGDPETSEAQNPLCLILPTLCPQPIAPAMSISELSYRVPPATPGCDPGGLGEAPSVHSRPPHFRPPGEH